MVEYADAPLEGVDIIVSERGDVGKPTGKVAWCFECNSMMIEVNWKDQEATQWICFSALKDLGVGIWQIHLKLCS